MVAVPSSTRTVTAFVALLVLLPHAQPSSAGIVSFAFPSFSSGSCSPGRGLVCMQNVAANNGYLSIDGQEMETVGRVLYSQPVILWPASFTTSFTINAWKKANSTANRGGMAFALVKELSPCPARSYGRYLGLFNKTPIGVTDDPQLALELDTFKDEFDPDNNHVGVDTTNIISDATFSLSGIGVNLAQGSDVDVKIVYDGWTMNLEVLVAYSGDTLRSILNYTTPPVIAPVYAGFTGSTGVNFSESYRILRWEFTAEPVSEYPKRSGGGASTGGGRDKRTVLVVGLPTAAGGALVLALLCFVALRRPTCGCRWKSRRRKDMESRSMNAADAPKMYKFRQLSRATQGFSRDNLVGRGGFGNVYKGTMSNPPTTVAVKRISATSKQGEREYLAEICTIGRLRHKNIVRLQGWCHHRKELLLIYEFMPNGSLDRFISNGSLDWPTRYKILLGLASALLYLHEECGKTVVHRDVKPNNVMLDSEYNARLGDFGLARRLGNGSSVTTTLAGTIGYLAPECGYTGRATPESDTFSFGIVVLEVVCGRRTVLGSSNHDLLDHVWELHERGELLEGVDPKLKGDFQEEEATRALLVGLSCARPNSSLRPSIRQVVQILTNPNEPIMELPKSRPRTIILPSSSSDPSATGPMTSATISESSARSHEQHNSDGWEIKKWGRRLLGHGDSCPSILY